MPAQVPHHHRRTPPFAGAQFAVDSKMQRMGTPPARQHMGFNEVFKEIQSTEMIFLVVIKYCF